MSGGGKTAAETRARRGQREEEKGGEGMHSTEGNTVILCKVRGGGGNMANVPALSINSKGVLCVVCRFARSQPSFK